MEIKMECEQGSSSCGALAPPPHSIIDPKVRNLRSGTTNTLFYQNRPPGAKAGPKGLGPPKKSQIRASSPRKWHFFKTCLIFYWKNLSLALSKNLLLKHPLIPQKNYKRSPTPPLKGPLSLARKPYSCKPREENVHDDGKALLELLLEALFLSLSLHP